MGRKPRIEFFGATYHVIQRGHNKAYIFEKDEDKMKLLSILGEAKELFDFNLIAYCIMDNHYHMVIKTHNIPISKIMHRINSLYAKYYNYKYERCGSPFQGRFKSLVVKNDSNLFNLINYVHNNPVYKNMIKSMTEYKWSSDVFYRMNLENFVDTYYFLDMLSNNRKSAIKSYVELMDVYDNDYEKLKKEFENQEIIDSTIRDSSSENRIKELDNVLRDVCNEDEAYKLIKFKSRKPYLMKYKYEYIERSIEQGFSHAEIGKNIGLTERAIRKYLYSKT